MKRRDFFLKTGSIFTAALLFPQITQACTPTSTDIGTRRPSPNAFTQPILKAIAIAMNAPNPHNTQAWKFKILSDVEALFYVDGSRLLVATDPSSRQMHIGCGCFLETLRLGVSTLELEADITWLPEGSYALEETGKKPVALIKVKPSKSTPLPLSEFIYSRQTNRSYYKGDIISNGEFLAVIGNAIPKHSSIICKNDPNELQKLIDILYNGMDLEAHTYTTYDESRRWFRSSQEAIEIHRDGINLRTDGTSGLKLSLMEFIVDENKPKSWHKQNAISAFLKTYREKMNTAKGVILFRTATNTQIDWLKTGIDYVRFQLAAHKHGFVIHPTSQVLQEYPEMDELRSEFNALVGCETPSKIQMAVRIGRGETLYYSYRRTPKDLLV